MEKKRILVIGAGLSGLSVSIHLQRKGAAVTLVDNQVNHSSLIAAGMINPLVFRRMTKGWRVDDFTPYLQGFYKSIEEATATSFFQAISIRRMFSSQHERELWLKKQERDDFKAYMTLVTNADDNYSGAINKFGSGRLKNTFAVATAVFLPAAQRLVAEQGKVLHESFDYDQLVGCTYRGETYDEIVFCEGYLGKSNPWFGDLPLNQTKGETLVIRTPHLPNDESLNRKCFILPKGDQTFKIGSTYAWHTNTTNITEEARAEMLENLSYLIEQEVEVIDQQAGVRPTTIDRRPLIGTHPDHKHYHIFNGLGTKGYMLAPLLSKEFADYLMDEIALSAEVNIERFYPGR